MAVYFQRVSILLNLCYLCLLKNCFFSFHENYQIKVLFIAEAVKNFITLAGLRIHSTMVHAVCCVCWCQQKGLHYAGRRSSLKSRGHEINVSTAPIVVTILFTPSISTSGIKTKPIYSYSDANYSTLRIFVLWIFWGCWTQ